MDGLIISDLKSEEQEEARDLILAGLEEHWGWLDPMRNPDLTEIGHSYLGETFLSARLDGELVGCGALIQEDEGVGRIVRMSVARTMRRKGVGKAILEALCQRARQRGFSRLVLETTETWEDAIHFYQQFGFEFTTYRDGDAHFVMRLS